MADEILTIQQGWATYAKEVMTPNAGANQRKETEMAFYGGASIVLQILAVISHDDYSDDAVLGIMTTLGEEVGIYAKLKGKKS